MPEKPILHVCHVDQKGPKLHACRKAYEALLEAGHDVEKVVYGKGKPFGLFTKGTRPELKAMSGQEMLPVLELPDGGTVNGAASIASWARSNVPVQSAAGPGMT
jgi:glutathione S-transferase